MKPTVRSDRPVRVDSNQREVGSLSSLATREVLVIFGMVFAADIVSGIASPTFSLYAKSLGASLVLIGALSAVVGLTTILSSVPIGVLTDIIGRKRVLSGGMLLLAGTAFGYSVAPSPYLLFPARVMAGLAFCSTFFVGAAHLGDVVTASDRELAIGVYTTSMGLGFALGPMIGGVIVTIAGYRPSYGVAAAFALAGFALVHFGLADQVQRPPLGRIRDRLSLLLPGHRPKRLSTILAEPRLLSVSLANMAMSAVFGGAIVNFFPLHAASLSTSQETIGYLFSIRALVSTAIRIPTALLASKVSSQRLVFVALLLAASVMFLLSLTTVPMIIAMGLTAEGIAWGVFFTAGQASVIAQSDRISRGTAMGVYGMAGSIGSTVGSIALGLIADRSGVIAVFRATGITALAGAGILLVLSMGRQRPAC